VLLHAPLRHAQLRPVHLHHALLLQSAEIRRPRCRRGSVGAWGGVRPAYMGGVHQSHQSH
jgi:hypothetical protein